MGEYTLYLSFDKTGKFDSHVQLGDLVFLHWSYVTKGAQIQKPSRYIMRDLQGRRVRTEYLGLLIIFAYHML